MFEEPKNENIKIIKKTEKNNYLKTKNRYYIAGWCDGEQSTDIVMRENTPEYQDYLSGYADAKENVFTMEGC